MSPAELTRLIATLEDEDKRKELLKDLRSLAAVAEEAPQTSTASEGDAWAWKDIPSWFTSRWDSLKRSLSTREGQIKFLLRLIFTAALLLASMGGSRLLRRRLSASAFSSPITITVSRVIIFLLTVFLLLLLWGADISTILLSPTAMRVSGSIATILLVVALGTGVWEVFNSYFRKRFAKLDTGTIPGRRLHTLLPLLRNIVRVLIIAVCLLLIMSEVGINIAPLLAGAGIMGLAVGFGAQTLVKDLINGFFVLAENAINVGDWVILGGHDGQVESLNIRNVRIRDIYGNVNIIPWSSVETVVNQTMDHGWAVVEPGVAYREDIDEVIEVIKEVAAEMRRDPDLNKDILSGLQILGLIELGDSAVVVRTRFKTTPFRRWFLERDFRRRLKNRFDELGIEIPYPHSTVYFGENKQGRASPARIEVLQNRGNEEE
ncbi:MAG: mechanosensitive ion channel [Desulfohalobiaceae bacterium]|nr:mechanosensitive ion channel [Desulfohalobiaceae bacterium]